MSVVSTPVLPWSSTEGIGWPALPDGANLRVLAVADQLRDSEHWDAQARREIQNRQLAMLLMHAHAQSPFWRQRLEGVLRGVDTITDDVWQRIPVLTRRDAQKAGRRLRARVVPAEHGNTGPCRTSGSSGKPFTAWITEAWTWINNAVQLRHYRWLGWDFSAKYASIRAFDEKPRPNAWIPAFHCGPVVTIDVRRPPSEQLDWLVAEAPTYLLTHPSNLEGLLARSRATGVKPGSLVALETFGEVLPAALRQRCLDEWGLEIADVYSSVECGTMALQCPDHPSNLHVMSERVRLEVLRDDGTQCLPGEVGEVVVTTLHGFAQPLIRYALGDFAEVGDACPCGRTLPVLRRILGRPRNRLLLPSGERIWPVHPDKLASIPGLTHFCIEQLSPTSLRLLVEMEGDVAPYQARIAEIVGEAVGHPFDVEVVQVDEIEPAVSGKRERVTATT